MAKGFGGMGGMNMNHLVKQAQKMQKQMADMQEALAEESLSVSSGGGAVSVVISGEKQIRELVISPDAIDPDDVEMLQDLIMSAVNEAIRQMDEHVNAKMAKITGGMGGMGGLPGMF